MAGTGAADSIARCPPLLQRNLRAWTMSSDESSVKLASELLASLDGAVNPVLGSGAPSQSAAVHDPNGFQIVQVGERGRLTLAPK